MTRSDNVTDDACVICKAQEATQALLCFKCNAGLCLFDDDPGRLREAATYLETMAK